MGAFAILAIGIGIGIGGSSGTTAAESASTTAAPTPSSSPSPVVLKMPDMAGKDVAQAVLLLSPYKLNYIDRKSAYTDVPLPANTERRVPDARTRPDQEHV
ncbi:hypothetical protein J7F03_38625 [Streptomyces sp. ISL-43]|uniref:hypothetical protein n=1 Tax=Streptomyces sp. ISL-43 TaxID=2819183 RepID=UPI001BE965B2|nr:hypothetical protein [Streptomyces sp. ISL-43]MBT2452849.1 hypothetical protein [Streptomyces sp. ISL-43]